MDIRRMTGLIVQRGPEYFVGRVIGTSDLRWSRSPWDAWFTRDREAARKVAQYVGGYLALFNPVAGQIREAVL